MDAKKVRNTGILGTLSLALALGVSMVGSLTAGAQSQPTGNDKPDPSHPIVKSINGNTLTLAVDLNNTRDVKLDSSTLVVKDGKFAGVSALKAGDHVQVNPSVTLPNGLEGHGTSSTNKSDPSTSVDPANPDKSGVGSPNEASPGQPDAPGGTSSPNTPQAPPDADNKNTPAQPDSGLLPGEGNGSTASSAASMIWVTSSTTDQLLGGVVYWAQGDTVVLNIPGVAYSEYVIHTSNNTGYQKMSSAAANPSAASATDMPVGSSVIVLGVDGGSDNAGFFTAKAVLVVPASGK